MNLIEFITQKRLHDATFTPAIGDGTLTLKIGDDITELPVKLRKVDYVNSIYSRDSNDRPVGYYCYMLELETNFEAVL